LPHNSPPNSGAANRATQDTQEEYFVDAAVAAAFLSCSRKHLLKLSILGRIPAHSLPGLGQRRTWRYLLSELRDSMLNAHMTGLGRNSAKTVPSPVGGSRKGGQ
jgi:hypothetical protein